MGHSVLRGPTKKALGILQIHHEDSANLPGQLTSENPSSIIKGKCSPTEPQYLNTVRAASPIPILRAVWG